MPRPKIIDPRPSEGMIMEHEPICYLLVDWENGALDPQRQREVAVHVRHCVDCQEWLEGYHLLSSAFPNQPEEPAHPSADRLARTMLRPQDQDDATASAIRKHLHECRQCRRDANLAIKALQSTRGDLEATSLRTLLRARWRELAIAALLALALLSSMPRNSDSAAFLSAIVDERSAPDRAERSQSLPSGYTLGEREFTGKHVVEVDDTLTLADLAVQSGAEVALRSSRLVAVGNGFQVASGARVVIGISSSTSNKED